MVLLARLDRGRILFLAPTKPLVEQHALFLRRVLKDGDVVTMMTGEMMPEKRKTTWEGARIVVSTPQVIENDLLSRRISLVDVSLIIFDEAHRAVGNYAYVYIAERYSREAANPLVLGITASPGSEKEKIAEICTNLFIENIQTRTEKDSDVAPFVHQREIEWVKLTVPKELLDIRTAIEEVLKDRIENLNRLGISPNEDRPQSLEKRAFRPSGHAHVLCQEAGQSGHLQRHLHSGRGSEALSCCRAGGDTGHRGHCSSTSRGWRVRPSPGAAPRHPDG